MQLVKDSSTSRDGVPIPTSTGSLLNWSPEKGLV
jgi:hypothetical protein